MGASDAYVGNQTAWANLADILSQSAGRGALTQERLQDMLIKRDAFQSDQLLKQALSGLAGQVGPDGQPIQTQPQPASVSPTDIITSRINDMSVQEKKLRDLARTPGIPTKAAMGFLDDANNISKTIAAEGTKLVDEQRKNFDYVAGLAGAVSADDPESLRTSYSQMKETAPRLTQALASRMDIDPVTGNPLPTARSYAAMAYASNAFAKRSEQLTDLHRQATERQTAAAEADRVEYRNARLEQINQAEADKNERAAAAQAGIAERARDRLDAKAAAQSPEAKRDKVLADFLSEWRAKYPFGAPTTVDYEGEKKKYFDAHKPPTTPAQDAAAGVPEAAAAIAADKAGQAVTTTVKAAPTVLPLPPKKDALVKDKVYQTARGPAKWNGSEFEAQ